MTAAESLLIYSYLLVIFAVLGLLVTLVNAVFEWLDREEP
jgi:hypothetical protein